MPEPSKGAKILLYINPPKGLQVINRSQCELRTQALHQVYTVAHG